MQCLFCPLARSVDGNHLYGCVRTADLKGKKLTYFSYSNRKYMYVNIQIVQRKKIK